MPSTPSTPSMGIGGGISVGQNTLMNEATGGEGRGGARTRIPSTRTTLGVVGTSTTITTTTIAETSTTTRATSPGSQPLA